MSAETLCWVIVAVVVGAYVLTEATYAIGRWADRHVADSFHHAHVAYGPDMRRMDERVKRAALGDER